MGKSGANAIEKHPNYPDKPVLAGILSLPWGQLGIYASNECLNRCDWMNKSIQPAAEDIGVAWYRRCLNEIHAYLQNPAHRFDLGLPTQGTDFQQRVWKALSEIPAGEVRTYGTLAADLGSSPRAVAQACRANPWALVIPCHRVVAADGPGGYGGASQGPLLALKQGLLVHEKAL